MSRFQVTVTGAGYGALIIVPELALQVDGGELLVILGSNGAGKSTALKAIVGLADSAQRRLLLDSADLSRQPLWRIARQGIAFVPDGARCFRNASVLDNLTGTLQSINPHCNRATETRLLDQVITLFPVLQERAGQLAGSLSGGQRQMLAIGRALMCQPRVLILDEPSAGLAPKLVEELFAALGRIKAHSKCAIVMAEQNVGYALDIADRCLVLVEGRCALEGPIDRVRNDDRLRVAYLGL